MPYSLYKRSVNTQVRDRLHHTIRCTAIPLRTTAYQQYGFRAKAISFAVSETSCCCICSCICDGAGPGRSPCVSKIRLEYNMPLFGPLCSSWLGQINGIEPVNLHFVRGFVVEPLWCGLLIEQIVQWKHCRIEYLSESGEAEGWHWCKARPVFALSPTTSHWLQHRHSIT